MFVASFVGESFFVPVTSDGTDFAVNGRKLKLSPGATVYPPGVHSLLLRMEKLHIATDRSADCNLFDARVKEIFFQGEALVLEVDLEGGVEAAIRLPNRQAEIAKVPGPGEMIRLALDDVDTVVLSGERP
jgi:hypothetical protein